MISTIHWLIAHSPITHKDPPYPQNPPTTYLIWPFLHFMMFYIIQTIYFLKASDTHYPVPVTHCPDAHSPITNTDPPYPHNPPTTHILWQYLNFIMFYSIQIIYFLKAGDTHYPLIMNHSDDVDILQYCSSTGPSVSRFGIFFRAHRYFSGFWKFFII